MTSVEQNAEQDCLVWYSLQYRFSVLVKTKPCSFSGTLLHSTVWFNVGILYCIMFVHKKIFFIFDMSYLYLESVLGPTWTETADGGVASRTPLSLRIHTNYANNCHSSLILNGNLTPNCFLYIKIWEPNFKNIIYFAQLFNFSRRQTTVNL